MITRIFPFLRWILLTGNLAALIGFTVRDRFVSFAIMMYIPLPILGLTAVILDLIRHGRSFNSPRFLLGSFGLFSIVISAPGMIGGGPSAASNPKPGTVDVKLLHWNVFWGGWPKSNNAWNSIEEMIREFGPDIIVLNEAPIASRLDAMERHLGTSWSSTRVEHHQGKRDWYKMVVFSRWPMKNAERLVVRHGTALRLRIEHPRGPFQILVVDGESRVTQSRTPFLTDLAKACRAAESQGTPFEVVLGDFNALSRSVGFEGLRVAAGGYVLASKSSSGWLGTWPVVCPVYDIDHVWVRSRNEVISAALFSNWNTDHRGQIVRIRLPLVGESRR